MPGISIGGGLSVGQGLSGGSSLSRGSGLSFPGFTSLSLNFTAPPLASFLTPVATSLGTLYDSSGYITYRPNNLLLNSATLSTQSVTTTSASPYILSFKGTGTVTLSGTSTAGPLVGTGASDRVSLKFSPTAGTLTLTVSGTVTEAQLEAVTYETEPRAYNATTGSAYYGPRYDYNPAHGQSGALLLQELARTNQISYSTDMSNVAYAKTNATATLSAILGPDNYTASYYVTATSAGGWVRYNAATSSTTTRCASVFLRRKTGTGEITFGAGTSLVTATNVPSSGWTRYQVNLLGQSGTYSVTSNVVTVTLTNHGFQNNDTLRADYTSGTAADANSGSITVVNANTFTYSQTTADTSGNVTIYPTFARLTLATNADEVYSWGWHFELGYGATSYIPTNGATITRTVEYLRADGTNFTNNFSINNGTYLLDFVCAADLIPSPGVGFATANFTIGNIAGATVVLYNINNLTDDTVRLISSGGLTIVSSKPSFSFGERVKIGASFGRANQTFTLAYKDGVNNSTNASFPTPDRLVLNGAINLGSNSAIWLRRMNYYNSYKTGAEMLGLMGGM